jgi:hypothetical protein
VSEQNLEKVRQIYAAARRRDPRVLELYHPEFEWDTTHHPIAGVIAGKVYRGHDGLRAWNRAWNEAFEGRIDELDELIDVGERVVSVSSMSARGRHSGAPVEWRGHAGVWSFRDGMAFRVEWFATREEALAAARQGAEWG